MPIYQYACQSCGHSLEALQKISDELLRVCPNCNEPELVKQLTAAAFKLKGTGWYETDFKDSGSKSESGADKKADKTESGADKKSTASTDGAGKTPPEKKSSDSGSGVSASGG